MKNSYSTLRAGVVASLLAFLFFAFMPVTGKFELPGTNAAMRTERPPNIVRFSENFDSVTAPSLPMGWTTSRVGANSLFETRAHGSSSPNALFTNNPITAGSSEITSPSISLGNSRARLIFKHAYQTDYRGDDGGVLEISVNSGPFQDVLQAGCEFVGGKYIGPLNSAEAAGNPLVGRQAWNRDSEGFKTTILNLPLNFANSSVRFRWRYGTNAAWEGIGWYIDDVKVEDFLPARISFREDFDSVSAPDLPANWTTAQTDPVRAFRTHTEASYTSPNSVFTPVPAAAGSAGIISPPIQVGGNSPKLTFQHRYLCDEPTEGGVLDISINGGPWRDIVEAGGQFVHGGYTDTITANHNPLQGRDAWTGATQGMIITQVNLPPSAYRQSVRFKWEWGTDPFILSIGWWIDSVEVTEELSGANLNAVSIPDSGVANPYPSEIVVSDHVGLISKVNVNLVNFSHSSPDDVDLLLVAPSGRKVVLMSDVGGSNPVSNISMTFDDRAPGSLPDNGQISGGVYQPTDFEPGDSFPPPAPGTAASRTLGLLNGTEPNGIWRLFAVDDNGNNTGGISGGWSLSVETMATMVTVPEIGVADPYPSERLVSGRPGTVTKVSVTLRNFSHSSPDDVDVLLVAPNGRRIVLMSDVGGSSEVGSIDVAVDDDAPGFLPDTGPLTTGAFKPTNYEPGDVFPAPAPSGAATATSLASFFGSPPNGSWKLFVVDDAGGNVGSISGEWDLDLESSTGACVFTISPTALSYPASGGSGTVGITMPAGCSWSASTDSSFVSLTTAATGDGNGSLGYSVAANTGPARTGAIDITNGVLTRSLLIQQPAGQARRSPFDFDADGRTDISIFRPSGGEWWYTKSSNGQVSAGAFGSSTDIITPGDFTGDGKTDFAFFRPSSGEWFILRSENNSFLAFPFGQNGDIPSPADYDNDGKFDAAVFRAGTWFIAQSAGGTIISNFGAEGDQPVPRDYDNDGKADIAIVRNQGGDKQWWINRSTAGLGAFVFGNASDKAVPGDYTGDGKADAALWRAGTGEWLILRSEDFSYFAFPFGQNGDTPAPGDYDGDGKFDAAVFRSPTSTWFVNRSGGSGVHIVGFGAPTDRPVPSAFVR